jgi:hypothetical protein
MKLTRLFEKIIRSGESRIIDGSLSSKEEELYTHDDSADYNICDLGLTSLKNCPAEIGDNFYADHNFFKDLIGGPEYVGGIYSVRYCKLTSLEGSPKHVTTFNCCNNKIKNLKYAPESVANDFFCSVNMITSLEFAPRIIMRHFKCASNRLENLKNIHKQIERVGGYFSCYDNPIKSHILGLMLIEIGGPIETHLGDGYDVDEILNKWKNQGRRGVVGCQLDLIRAGYKELALL